MSIYISASLLEDFISCNRKVYYRINKPELQIQNTEMVLGEIVHSAIEKFSDNLEKGFDFIDKQIDLRLEGSPTGKGFAQNCFNTYFEHFARFTTPNDSIEIRFKLPWDKDVFLVGKIDRISDGNVFDWKTARNPATNIDGNIQFILYHYAYKHMYNKIPSGVFYAALTTGKLIRYGHDEAAQRTLFNEIIPQAVLAIRKGDFTRSGIFRRACFKCSYKEDCLKEFEHGMDSTTSIKK